MVASILMRYEIFARQKLFAVCTYRHRTQRNVRDAEESIWRRDYKSDKERKSSENFKRLS